MHQLAVDKNYVIRAADDFEWVDEMVYDRGKEQVDGIMVYICNHKARLRHYRPKKEMQLRRKQQQEQATEIQITIIETQQQQKHKNKDDKKSKEITKLNHTTEWIKEWLALITQLDGTGDGRT